MTNHKQKIKILYGIEACDGGALKHLMYLVRHVNKEAFDINVILSLKRNPNLSAEIQKMKENGATLFIIPMHRSFRPLLDLCSIVKVKKIINQVKPDIIHAHSSKAGFVFRLANAFNKSIKSIYTPHCFYFMSKKGLYRKFYSLIERFLSLITDKIILSDDEMDMAKKYRIASQEKLININNAINFNDYKHYTNTKAIKKEFGIPEGKIVIGAVGRLTKQKGWDVFIHVASNILKYKKEVVFLITGKGEEYYYLKKLTEKLNLQEIVIFTGFVNDISKIYSIIDIYLNTSLWEGLPYTIIEAQHFDKPIILSNQIIKDQKHQSPDKPAVTIDIIVKKIIDIIESNKQSINNKMDTKKRYSFEKFVQEHTNIYFVTKPLETNAL